MDTYLPWLIAGFVLIIVELVTGTFFLLVLGVAALAGGAVAWANQPLWMQAAVSVVVAVIGVAAIHRRRTSRVMSPTGSNAIDVGQAVTIDTWVNEADGIARVQYRGAQWDAHIVGERSPGGTYYIRGVEGSTLRIAAGKH
jgi:membrane protein implicated in regulation of membrane protease activity